MQNLLIAILGGGNLLLFIKFLIERHDKKKEEEKGDIRSEMATLKRDGIRTQLLLLILLMPNEKKEILTVAENYFSEPPKGLGGDWYMTSIFNKWLTQNTLDRPEWFDRREKRNE